LWRVSRRRLVSEEAASRVADWVVMIFCTSKAAHQAPDSRQRHAVQVGFRILENQDGPVRVAVALRQPAQDDGGKDQQSQSLDRRAGQPVRPGLCQSGRAAHQFADGFLAETGGRVESDAHVFEQLFGGNHPGFHVDVVILRPARYHGVKVPVDPLLQFASLRIVCQPGVPAIAAAKSCGRQRAAAQVDQRVEAANQGQQLGVVAAASTVDGADDPAGGHARRRISRWVCFQPHQELSQGAAALRNQLGEGLHLGLTPGTDFLFVEDQIDTDRVWYRTRIDGSATIAAGLVKVPALELRRIIRA
jgi:hypothetical protein